MKLLRLGLILLVIVNLVGCAHIRADDSIRNYQKFAKIVPPVKSPPGVALKTGENYYPIPHIAYQPVRIKVSKLPPGSNIAQYRARLHKRKPRV